ncbi:sulfurtransferase [Tessaracoccus massiliensis]|uniref:sulfurtransferase n=1 Tax=Tessaracoccus massiliensis TaxID=1522311 RepID=UPI00058E29C4|nr:sulfurtransferase [Tessaracoccus massiliensis]
MIPPVVDIDWLKSHPDAVLADVRHYLDGRSGAEAYAAGHLPGAVFVAIDDVLADPPTADRGRHPLPDPQRFADGLGAVGIGDDTTVVAYDDAGGAMAARLVWLLRMLGRDAALLDGGLQAYDDDLSTEAPVATRATFTVQPWPTEALATIDEAAAGETVLDARAGERFRGESEPLDARAGHIPGARNFPLAGNLDATGRFLSPAQLRERFSGIDDAREVISYCGSGITACHNLIAMERAGLGQGRLYPGSWSQYSGTDRPISTGD